MSLKLSVCITTYNRAEGLDRTLDSLSKQMRLPDELIVSDDCSLDNTPQVVEKWKNQFPLLRYNRNSLNINMPGNLNVAIDMAQGEYIANLHDADTFDPALLEKWERSLDTYPTAGFVFCGIGGWSHRTKFGKGIILHNVSPFTPGREFFEKNFLHKLSSIVWGTVMARRKAYDRLLPFNPKFCYISDVDMWMRMCLFHDVAYVREPLIVLDNTPTPWRSFQWERLELMRRMQVVNILRFYGDQPKRLRREMIRHQQVVQKVYFRRLLGRLWHRDWLGLHTGIKLCRNLNWPLRLLGMIANG